MKGTEIIHRLLFEYNALSEEDIKSLIAQSPRKFVR